MSQSSGTLLGLYLEYKHEIPKFKGYTRQKLVYLAVVTLQALLKTSGLDQRRRVELHLELASILINETTSMEHAQEVISKGILIALEGHLDHLRIQLQLLSVQLLAAKRTRAAIKLAESCYEDSKLLQDPWLLTCSRLILLNLRSSVDSKLYNELVASCPFPQIQALACILHCFKYLAVGSLQEADSCLKTIDGITGELLNLQPQLECMRACAGLLVALGFGDPRRIQESMSLLHSLIESQKDDGNDNWIGWNSNGTISVYTDSNSPPITIQWYPKLSIFTVSYLLSGIASMNFGKIKAARKFFEEGIKLAKSLHNSNGLLAALLFHTALLLYSNSDSKTGLQYIQQLEKLGSRHNKDLPIHSYVKYLYGVHYQSKRDLDQAIQFYQLVVQDIQNNHNSGNEIGMLANLNLVLINGSEASKDSVQVALEYCRESPNILLKCVERIIEAAFLVSASNQVDHHNLVADLLKTSSVIQSSQIRSIVSYIGSQYAGDMQSQLKMAQMGFTEAQRSKNILWSYLNGSLFELLLRQSGNLPLAEKQKEINYRLYADMNSPSP